MISNDQNKSRESTNLLMSLSNLMQRYAGHLVAGQETTTNTYVGHVFFFTLHSDKTVEVARFLMHASQVRKQQDFRILVLIVSSVGTRIAAVTMYPHFPNPCR
jgi:hypothetical protein